MAFIGLLFFLASGLSLLNGSKSFIIVFTMMYGEWLAAKFGILALFAAHPALLTKANWLYYVAGTSVAVALVASQWLLPPYDLIWLLVCYMGVAVTVAIFHVKHIDSQPSSSLVC